MYMNNINGIITKSSTKLNVPIINVPEPGSLASVDMPTTQGTWFTGRNMITLGLLLVILALLGMNILGYFAEGVDIFGALLQKLGIGTIKTVEKTVDVSMDGVKLGADITAGAVKDAANIALPKSKQSKQSKQPKGTISEAVQKKSETSDDLTSNGIGQNSKVKFPQEDDSESSKIQTRVSNQKAGWCYVGTDRNIRSCIEVGESNKCMSGDIFPSRELCMNPNLRA